MNEIYKYRDEDGDEVEFLPEFAWQVANPKDFANTVAEMDYDQSNSDLHDPAHWPRTYEIWWETEWVAVSVDLEYMPCFSSKILGANAKGHAAAGTNSQKDQTARKPSHEPTC